MSRSWTDEQLREAVATSTSLNQVLRKLGLKHGSRAYLRRAMRRLGLHTSHFVHPTQRNDLCSDVELRELVRGSQSRTQVLEKLGIEPRTAHFDKLNRRIKALRLDTSHFIRRAWTGQRGARWTNSDLAAAVSSSTSIAQTLRKLGLVPAGGNYGHIQRRIADLSLDTSHFTGRGWNVGGAFRPSRPAPLEDVLVAGRGTTTHHLKLRLFRAGLKQPACELCGWAERAPDGRIPVELDHRNGDRNDNRLENLRILCPNCHSLQPTHRGLNQRRRREHPEAGQ